MPAVLWSGSRLVRLGIRIASTARVIAEPFTRATTGWKVCSLRPMPPTSIERPRASSRLAITVPVMLAFTITTRPAFRAVSAMISSVALPNRALSRAPMLGPRASESSSVAVLSQTARGRIASTANTNTAPSPQWRRSASAERGTNNSRSRATIWRSFIPPTQPRRAHASPHCEHGRPRLPVLPAKPRREAPEASFLHTASRRDQAGLANGSRHLSESQPAGPASCSSPLS